MPRVGVIGTMVWDRIHARDGRMEPIEEWGGISYALSAWAAARTPDLEVVPIIKIGQDLDEAARRFLAELPGLHVGAGVKTVPEPNNRVELRYQDNVRRCERLTGGVPPWTWPELEPLVRDLDALYVNFISGFEMDLETAASLRQAFPGPIYADLHSLLLGILPDGLRTPRPLEAWREWMRCFDIVQVNEDELVWLAGAWGDPWVFAAEVVGEMPRLLLITLGARGAAYVAAPEFRPDPLAWRDGGLIAPKPVGVTGAVRTERVFQLDEIRDGDPTGCGDVWGSTCFARLLAGDPLREAMVAANRAAARNVQHRGATGLYHFLQGRIET
ncbi:MAG TPA: carbohydrate kinase family protein [Longimicrobiales bacterium]|nr:carbohydrate kinase family protein [Longimicrobiales bacterium]